MKTTIHLRWLTALLLASHVAAAMAGAPNDDASAAPPVIEIWPGRVPDESGDIGPERTRLSPKLERKQVEVTEQTQLITAVSKPSITIYRPTAEKNTGTAMLICPGGGYWDLYWQLEGEEVAAWLNSIGVTGIILKYRVPRRPDEPKGEPARRPLQDAQRAMSLVRSRAGEWGLHPNRIGIVGFSAGGHLAIATATSFNKRTYEPIDDADKVSCRPDFAIPVYSGYLKVQDKDELAPGLTVPAGTPPVFLVHGSDDIISPPEHSVMMYLALKRAGVPAELHVYSNTTHDFGVRASDRPYSTWTMSCAHWLRDRGFLTPPAGPVAATGRSAPPSGTVRVAAAQAASRVVDFHLPPDGALAAVEKNLGELESIINRAGEQQCDALVLPEDTPGLLNWMGANEAAAKALLPKAVNRMIEQLGSAAARYKMYLVVCSDFTESDGGVYNTAFLLGRDGKEIGRYHKVCPTWGESGARRRGVSFPVFPTPDLGTAGMLICYDLVIPETARCLALQGADIIFFPTMGGAAIGRDDIGEQALRVRAAENFIWLAVAQRGKGAMIISPQGKIVSKAEGPDGLAIADIDPHGQREGGDAMNWQRDMRARLFRERNPDAFHLLTHPSPPVIDKVPIGLTPHEAGRIMARALTTGDEEFSAAGGLVARGNISEAIAAFERLRKEYPATWIERSSEAQLAKLKPRAATNSK